MANLCHAVEHIPDAAAVTSAKDMYTRLKTTAPDLVSDFDQKYDAWKQTWDRDNVNVNVNIGSEYDALVALGPKVMPLIVYRMTSGDDFMAVDLHNELEDPLYKVEVEEPKDICKYKLATKEIVDMHSERSVQVKNALIAWAEFRFQRQHYQSSFHFTEGEAYWTLVDIGRGIIAPMMLEYYNDIGGWWHELLHELVHGKKSEAQIFFKPVLFAEWKDWFEHKDHKDAPEGPDARARWGHGYRADDFRPTS